jgi:peptidoglycan/LPS O-acetylase OafA/YrhL
MKKILNYYPEIDGLRAFAVFSVILYHANFIFFGDIFLKGGFLGVDVFFVISGFLITSILVRGFRNNSLNLSTFYEKRARRILPILLFVITATIPFSWLILLPSDFQSYSDQFLSAIFSFSNFYFWNEDSYWASEAIFKIFLHTWSLGVEEQFYFIMPLIILFFVRKKINNKIFLIYFIFFIALSLFASHFYSTKYAQSTFFLLPFRAWELLIGSCLALIKYNTIAMHYKDRYSFLPTIGFVVLIFSFFVFDKNILHPSVYTSIPLVGVSMIIIFSNKNDYSIRLLKNKIVVFLGLISYGLYLWHYPVFSFLAHLALDGFFLKILAIATIIILASISFWLIERPFRSFKLVSSKKFFFIITLWIICLSIFGFFGQKDGFSNRFSNLLDNPGEPDPIENHKWFYSKNASNNGRIILIGDSHIKAIGRTFRDWSVAHGYDYSQSSTTSCLFILNLNRVRISDHLPEERCSSKFQNERIQFLSELEPSIILVGGRFVAAIEEEKFDNQEGGFEGIKTYYLQNNENSLKTLADRQSAIVNNFLLTIKKVISFGHTVVLLYPIPEVGVHVPRFLKNNPNKQLTTSYIVFQERTKKIYELFDKIDSPNVFRIYPEEIFCTNKTRCITHDLDVSFYRDDDHLNPHGAKLILDQFKRLLISKDFNYQK